MKRKTTQKIPPCAPDPLRDFAVQELRALVRDIKAGRARICAIDSAYEMPKVVFSGGRFTTVKGNDIYYRTIHVERAK